ncbi:MAG: ModD protein [Campylobacteraceae bacterium]|jgi:molybdenum transport protein|nr:ModD protein [Campylobacteraceae bacterium]
MVYISDFTIQGWIGEDVGYFDLTTAECDIAAKLASLEIVSRDSCTVCGSEEAAMVAKMLGLEVDFFVGSGVEVAPQTTVLKAKGSAQNVHLAWRVAQNILSFSSSIATNTKRLITLARAESPDILVGGTRKTVPGAKALAVKAVLCAGGIIHRLGLSETFVMFEEHMKFFNSQGEVAEKLLSVKKRLKEKKIVVEVKSVEQALYFAPFADMLQLDKLSPAEIAEIKNKTKGVTLAAAGGIDEGNIQAYAKTKVDVIVTSSMYKDSASVDFGVKIEPISSI